MTDNQLLERASIEAVRSAAEKLNVDPLGFARFPQQGRIADVLSALGREEAMAAHRAEMSEPKPARSRGATSSSWSRRTACGYRGTTEPRTGAS